MLSKLRRWLREGAILLVLLAGVIILLDVWRSPQMPAMFDSTPLHTLDGETVTLASISEERPVLLYFWASWCGICRFTTPDVARLQSEGESVMTIALRSGNDGEVSRWLSRKRVTFPVVNDSGGAGGNYDQRLDQLLGHEVTSVAGSHVLIACRGNPAFFNPL